MTEANKAKDDEIADLQFQLDGEKRARCDVTVELEALEKAHNRLMEIHASLNVDYAELYVCPPLLSFQHR